MKDNAEIWAKAIGGSEIGPAQEKVKEPEGPTAITKESYLGGRVISWIYNNGEPISKEGHWCWREIENSYMKMAKLVEWTASMINESKNQSVAIGSDVSLIM